MAPQREFTKGMWTPLVVAFREDEEIDFAAFEKQVLRVAQAGVSLVIHGTNGEEKAAHLSNQERSDVIKSARKVLDSNGFKDRPILAGTGTGSAKETIKLCSEAKQAGADYAIVIAPGYFAGAIGKNRPALLSFFREILDKSELPVLIYNFPAAAGGIDLDSDLIIELSEHPNCCGCKLTCAMIGKGFRIARHAQSEEYKKRHPLPFHVLPGYSDYTLFALQAGSSGVITGTGNVIPNTMAKLYETSMAAIASGKPEDMAKALDLQEIVSEADWTIVKSGIAGTKMALSEFIEPGLGGTVRRPLLKADDATKAMLEKGLKRALDLEKSL